LTKIIVSGKKGEYLFNVQKLFYETDIMCNPGNPDISFGIRPANRTTETINKTGLPA